jgi:outer membrane protein
MMSITSKTHRCCRWIGVALCSLFFFNGLAEAAAPACPATPTHKTEVKKKPKPPVACKVPAKKKVVHTAPVATPVVVAQPAPPPPPPPAPVFAPANRPMQAAVYYEKPYPLIPAREAPAKPSGWSGDIGVGAGTLPKFEGANKYKAVPLVHGKVAYDDFYLAVESMNTNGAAAKLNVVPLSSVHFGPMLNYRLGRETTTDNRLQKLPVLDEAIEAGVFLRFNFKGFSQSDSSGLEFRALTDVSGVHDGNILEAKIDYTKMISKSFSLGTAVRTSYVNSDYARTYFGVTAAQQSASGLAESNPEGGVKDVSLDLSATYILSPKWSLTGLASYSRLLGDIADSSIVKDAGNENEYRGGMLVTRKF